MNACELLEYKCTSYLEITVFSDDLLMLYHFL